MHAKPDLRVVLKWMITRSGSVIADVICSTMNKKISIGCAVCLMILGAVAFIVVSKIPALPDVSATPEQAFATLCQMELPETISNIECHGAFWMDHSFAIRFSATKSDIEQILSSNFTETSWETVQAKFADPPYHSDFRGRWTPDEITHKACYSRTSKSVDYSEESFLVIDHKSGLVYGIGEGSVQ